MNRTVVVTGLGIVSPLESGRGLETFWDKALKGENKIKKVISFNVEKYPAKLAAEIEGFGTQGECNNKWMQIAKVAFNEAINDASLIMDDGFGISIGTVLGGILLGEQHWRNSSDYKSIRLPTEYSLSNGVRWFIKNHSIKCPALTVSTACASGTDAIGIAYRKILSGKTDIMIAGGIDVLSEFAFSGFNILQAMTKEKVRPFDKRRDGLALGEGAAFVVLESLNSAARRKVNIYGKVAGYASRGDAHHLTGPEKEGRGLADAIRASMKEAGLQPSNMDYINAHGTGTVYNDLMETKAVKSVFGKDAYNIPLNSMKAMIGHSFGAAGTIEAITCLLVIRDGIVPPTINYGEKDPECDLDYVPNKARKHKVKTALSLSAGFGGQNAAIIFKVP